jgi:hypothetical protein
MPCTCSRVHASPKGGLVVPLIILAYGNSLMPAPAVVHHTSPKGRTSTLKDQADRG